MKYVFWVFIILIAVSTVYAQDNETVWRQVSENNYINIDGIVKTQDKIFSFILKAYNKGQYEPVNGNRIRYTLSSYTVDCENYTYKIGVIDSYGYQDNFVNGDYNKYAKFQPIADGTAVGAVAKKLCRR